MKSICGIIIAVLVTNSYSMPAGEVANQPPQLSDLITQAQASINNFGEELKKKLNLPDQETVAKTIQSQTTNFVNNVQDYVKKVSEDIKTKNPELEKVWDDIKEKFNKVTDDINAQIPNAQDQAKQLQEKLTQGFNTLVEESNKASKAIGKDSEKIQEDVAKITKQAIELVLETTKNFETKLRELAVTEAPK
uniref:Apolipophorin n=1 Tax=Cotesia flavipes TaxID=89805 RepID=A0A8K1YTM5_COTFL|nr:apolipophorin [Cotesia flavipes]